MDTKREGRGNYKPTKAEIFPALEVVPIIFWYSLFFLYRNHRGTAPKKYAVRFDFCGGSDQLSSSSAPTQELPINGGEAGFASQI